MAIPTGRIEKICFYYHFSSRATFGVGKLNDNYYEYSLRLSLSRDIPTFPIEYNLNYQFQSEISINYIASQGVHNSL